MALSNSQYQFARTWAFRLLRVESILLMAVLPYMGILAIAGQVKKPLALIGVLLFAAAGSVGLWFAAKGFKDGKAYGRAPAVLANGIALGVANFMRGGEFYRGAVFLGLLAAVTLVVSLFGYRE